MEQESCKTCQGTGKITEVSTNSKGYTKMTCIDCGGYGFRLRPKSKDKVDPRDLPSDDPRSMKSDEYEAERLGVVIFLIGASLAGLQIGVEFFDIASSWKELPPWYYLVDVAVVGLVAWRFRPIVATLTWIALLGAFLYWGGGFVIKHFF